jgi:streptogramin lyase
VTTIALVAMLPLAVAAPTPPRKQGEVPVAAAVPVAAGATDLGAARGTDNLTLTVAFRPRNAPELRTFVDMASEPRSPLRGRFLTTPEFAARFGATPQAIRTVSAWLRARGLEVGAVSSNRLSVTVSGRIAAVERAFSVRLDRFALHDRTTVTANTTAARVPSRLAADVEALVGLDGLDRLAPGPARTPAVARPPDASSTCSGYSAGSTDYTPAALRKSNNFGGLLETGREASGVTVALIETDSFRTSDVTCFEKQFGGALKISTVLVDDKTQPSSDGPATALDLDVLAGLAPDASINVYETCGSDDSCLYDAYRRAVTQDKNQVISSGAGTCEVGNTVLGAENDLLQEAAAQGQTVVAPSGDTGSEGCLDLTGKKSLLLQDPASQPYVTGVGGTSLDMTEGTESVWNSRGSINPADTTGASGGGISKRWAAPSWQAGTGVVNGDSHYGSFCTAPAAERCREVPDVSAAAGGSGNYPIYDTEKSSGWSLVDGTSASAALWASLIADANNSCGTRVGFLNPSLYAIAAAHPDDLHDVGSGGDNDYTGTHKGAYPTTNGYDMATGLGTPDATRIAGALCPATPPGSGGAYGGIDGPHGITTGPDGALWFTNIGGDSIGRITTSGTVTTYADRGIERPEGITAGSDGALWFTNTFGGADGDGSIGRITTSGVVTTYTNRGIDEPEAITAGPDGALWFTDTGDEVDGGDDQGSIGRITTSGAVTTYTNRAVDSPEGITAGPDGALWFTNAGAADGGSGDGSIGRITTSGAVRTYTTSGIDNPEGITAGPDGAVWFANTLGGANGGGSIGRITTSGTVTTRTNSNIDNPEEITAGPDGALWFTNTGNGDAGSIGRITTSGTVTTRTNSNIDSPYGITAGPDGALWFTNTGAGDNGDGSIGRITTSGAVTTRTNDNTDSPYAITAGSDGALWFTNTFGGDDGNGSIGRITTSGGVTNYTGSNMDGPYGITGGPDDALWFTNIGGGVNGDGSIGRITTSGAVSIYTDSNIDGPGGITAGPDGAVWFTNAFGGLNGDGSIGRITTSGAVSTFTNGRIDDPEGITTGSDGALWFTNPDGHSIGRITTTGVVTIYTNSKIDRPEGITAGPDGALWFTNDGDGDGSIGRITTSGAVTTYTSSGIDGPEGITAGPDGALWFTNDGDGDGSIGRITTSGAVTRYTDNDMDGPFGIAAGPDGALWFTNGSGDSIGRITTGGTARSPRTAGA